MAAPKVSEVLKFMKPEGNEVNILYAPSANLIYYYAPVRTCKKYSTYNFYRLKKVVECF